MSVYARAIDAIDWPLSPAVFAESCAECEAPILADTPVYYDPDGEVVGDPPQLVDRSTWLCLPCATERGVL